MTSVRIPLAVPCLEGHALEYLRQCIESNYVSSVGPFVEQFEEDFSAVVGARHAIACSSGTAAIHLALLAAGVGAGDEILVSDLTFIASANPARYCGANVTLVDSEPETWNLDPRLVARELRARASNQTSMPKAIVAVDLLGHPGHFEELIEDCASEDVVVIEDAAEALGARWLKGRLAEKVAGTAGALGCYSFNGNKVITTGAGGMVVTDDRALAEHVRHLSTQARLPGVAYVHDQIGYNYRLSNIAAALGLAQLEQLDSFVEKKRAIASRYDEAFADCRGLGTPPDASWARRSAWMYSILLEDQPARERVRLNLLDEGIEARPIWPALHTQLPYLDADRLGSGGVAADLSSRALSLPCSVSLSVDEQDAVLKTVLATNRIRR